MKPHNKFMEEVEEASSLPAQTKKALGPESQEDFDTLQKEWEKEAPICNECKRKDRWNSLAKNIETGKEFYICNCGNEQDKLSDLQKADIDAIENDPTWSDGL